jgi:hypothetical protein
MSYAEEVAKFTALGLRQGVDYRVVDGIGILVKQDEVGARDRGT